jgi:hypothetical protein
LRKKLQREKVTGKQQLYGKITKLLARRKRKERTKNDPKVHPL